MVGAVGYDENGWGCPHVEFISGSFCYLLVIKVKYLSTGVADRVAPLAIPKYEQAKWRVS
jgi:hypothetical protein